MSNKVIISSLITSIVLTGLGAEFLERHESKDPERVRNINLLNLLRNTVNMVGVINHRREVTDSDDQWPGRWMPERPTDPKPPPKIFHKFEIHQNNQMSDSLNKNSMEDENRNSEIEDISDKWSGRWMPERPTDPKPPPKIFHKLDVNHNMSLDEHGRILMGVLSETCDNGKTNLTVDWDYSPINHTCYGKRIVPDYQIIPQVYCEHIPPEYYAMHKCMQDTIEYDELIPIYGTHRPIWPVYGEYKFVPRQRWLHNLEHGGLVMLHHPCANPLEVKRLKSLVTGCIRRHIITPSNLLNKERPLALVTWGCRLTMSYVEPEIVERFILTRALRGPEDIEKDGDFSEGLLRKAKIVSDIKDSTLCPYSEFIKKGKVM